MKLPKRIAELLRRKQEFIDAQRDRLENTVIRQQSVLFNDMLNEVLPQLDVKDGVIQETAKNYRLISSLDKAYKNFQLASNQIFLNQIVLNTAKISSLNETYFKVVLGSDITERFVSVIEKTNKLMNLRLGLDGGKLVRGGFLQSFFDSNTIGTELKQMTSKAITSNMNMKDYTTMLKDKITGTDEYTGGLERQFQRYAYDLYQQYDRTYSKTLGDEFGFTYFVYQGGLVKDSREFCVEHNNKVYSVEEAQEWSTWRSPTTGETPSYLGYPGYDPMTDFGGYNCRHFPGWISEELAKEMRPGLKI
jgi:hypothetical protein